MKGKRKKFKIHLPVENKQETNLLNKLLPTICDTTKGAINSYFSEDVKVHNYTFNDALTSEVHVPSPDDAALPYENQDGLLSDKSLHDKLATASNCKLDMKQNKNDAVSVMEYKGILCHSDKVVAVSNYKSDLKQNESTISIVEHNEKKIITAKQKFNEQKLKISHKKLNATIKRKSSKTNKTTSLKCKTIEEFFPIRRSDRRTSVSIKQEIKKEVEDAIISGKEDGFEIKEFSNKGRGVITTKLIKRGEFVLEYHGDLIDIEEAKKREKLYANEENIGCYMYYFTFRNKQYCVDATKESGRLGRLVNHSKKGNLKTEPFAVLDKPHLILVARQDIQPGEELLYDYGDRSKMSLEFHPWLAT